MHRLLYITLFLVYLLPLNLKAQEMNATVQVMAPKLQTTEPSVFKTMETSVYEFINNRKWTNDVFGPEERIECTFLINVTEELGSDKYKGQLTIQASRPVLNSSYNSVLLNYVDRDFVFDYVEHQPIEFNENNYISNLSSVLAYWTYIIIGMDYDSFGPDGGTPHYLKAQAIVSSVPPNLNDVPGWKAFDSNRNRYWLVENLLNSRFKVMRDASYTYHLSGLDHMYENVNTGRQVVMGSLQAMEQTVRDFPNNMLIQLFFNSKSDELINIFSGAPPPEKAAAVQLLYRLDATNAQKYSRILKN